MKFLVILALVCLSVHGMRLSQDNSMALDAEVFLENFFSSAFGIELSLHKCEQDASASIQVLHEVADMLKDMEIDTIVKVVKHLKENAHFFTDAVKDCKSCGPDFMRGINMLSPLLNAGVAAKSVKNAALHHPIAFPSNLAKAKSGFSAGDYAKAGKYAGKDVAYIVAELPKAQELLDTQENLELFLDSFYTYAFGIPLKLHECAETSATSLQVIKKALHLIKDHSDAKDVALCMFYIKKHFADISVAYKDCSAAAPQLIKGLGLMKPFTSPSTIKDTSTSAIKHHPIAFPVHIKKAQSAISAGDWADAGEHLGKDFHFMIDELPVDEELLAFFN